MTNAWESLESFAFGDSPDMADRLLGFVIGGSKRATCWSVTDGQQTQMGKQMVVLDGSGKPRAVIETVELEQRRFCDVDLQFALDEGEGDETLDDWREGHRAYFAPDGNLDSCIVLRTGVVKDGVLHVQAGAGIVADSDPAYEQRECEAKAGALIVAAQEAVRVAGEAGFGQ